MSKKEHMTVKNLKDIINSQDHQDEKLVKVVLNIPSIGPKATTKVVSAYFGFDWDNGLLIHTEELIAPKTQDHDLFEKGKDLLMYLATEWYTQKKDNYPNRRAKDILLKSGYSEEDLRKYVSLFHKDKEIVR